MTGKLSKAIRNSLSEHEDFWNGFNKVIVYYDNGQVELTKILSSVFNTYFSSVEFRKVAPVQYKLFQVADLICTMELLKEKAETKKRSEENAQKQKTEGSQAPKLPEPKNEKTPKTAPEMTT